MSIHLSSLRAQALPELVREAQASFGKQIAAASREAPRRDAADTRSFDDKVIAP